MDNLYVKTSNNSPKIHTLVENIIYRTLIRHVQSSEGKGGKQMNEYWTREVGFMTKSKK